MSLICQEWKLKGLTKEWSIKKFKSKTIEIG